MCRLTSCWERFFDPSGAVQENKVILHKEGYRWPDVDRLGRNEHTAKLNGTKIHTEFCGKKFLQN